MCVPFFCVKEKEMSDRMKSYDGYVHLFCFITSFVLGPQVMILSLHLVLILKSHFLLLLMLLLSFSSFFLSIERNEKRKISRRIEGNSERWKWIPVLRIVYETTRHTWSSIHGISINRWEEEREEKTKRQGDELVYCLSTSPCVMVNINNQRETRKRGQHTHTVSYLFLLFSSKKKKKKEKILKVCRDVYVCDD